MPYFITLWILYSLFCSIIAAIISKLGTVNGSVDFVGIAIIIHWILLGLGQWKLLDSHIPNAYAWGILTIVGGIISCFVIAAGLLSTFYILFKDASFILLIGGSRKGPGDFVTAILILVTIFSWFVTGFLLGWLQKLVLQYSVSSSYFYLLPLSTAFLWVLIVPAFGSLFLLLAKYNFLSYIFGIAFSSILINLIKGLMIYKILSVS